MPAQIAAILVWQVLVSAAAEEIRFEIPMRPPLLTTRTGEAPLELRQLSIVQDGAVTQDGRVVLQEREPFTAEAVLVRRASPDVPKGSVQFRIEGAGPVLTNQFPLDKAPWPIGALRTMNFRIVFPPLRYSGRATLYVDYLPEGALEGPALWAQPIFIRAAAVSTEIDRRLIRETFGSEVFRLAKAFRLGPGAELELPFPMDIRAVKAIGLVSHTNYDNDTRTGEAVAQIEFLDSGGSTRETILVRSGITTAKRDHDEYAPGTLKTRKVAVYSSEASPRPSRATDEPYELHDYASVFVFDATVNAVSMRVRYLRDDGIFQVGEVLLYPAEQTAQ